MVNFGLTLSNRGVVTGASTLDDMIALAQRADADERWDSIWVGDSILAKPRLDALGLMSALAVVTERVRIGPACFASTPLRDALLLAYQYASLDFMSNGRSIFAACMGTPEQCVSDIQSYIDAGATTITLRLVGYDQQSMYDRVVNEVLSAFD